MKHDAHASLGRQTSVPIMGALGMIVVFVQLLKKSFILSVVQHGLAMPAVDGLLQTSALCTIVGATGEAVHNGRN